MDERLKVYEEKMTKSYDAMIREFTAIRAGRANPHVLDKLKVDYYGTPTPHSAGGKYLRTGAQNAADSALGKEPDQGHREGDYDL